MSSPPWEFVHDFRPNFSPTLSQEFGPNGKLYRAPDGTAYESVTTVIGRYFNKDLSKWRKRVGEQEAARITNQAALKGSGIHKLCEGYLLNDPDYKVGAGVYEKAQFAKHIRPLLDRYVSKVYGIECSLTSDYLRCAGTADLICEWDGVPAIVDFKGSVRLKKEEWIESYFVQASTYALMASARLGLPPIRKIVIIISPDNEPMPQVFIKDPAKYTALVQRIFVEREIDYGLTGPQETPTPAARKLG